MLAEQKAITAVGFVTDTASVTKAAASYETVGAAASKFSAEVLRLNPGLAALAAQEKAVAQHAAQSAQQIVQAQGEVAKSYDQVAASATKASDAQDGKIGGVRTGFNTLRAAGAAVSNIGGGSGVTQAASLIGLAELGPAAVAAGVLGVALHSVTAEMEKETEALETRLDIERKGAREIADLTTQGIKERIEAARQQLAIDRGVSDKQTVNSALYFNTNLASNALALGRALAGLDPVYNAYQDALAKNKVALEGDQALIDVFTDALNSNAGAVNTATEEQLDSAKRALEIDGLTREEREKHIAQNERDIATLTAMAESGTLTGDAFNELLAQIYDLRIETEDLQAATNTYADQLEREKAAKQLLVDQTDNYFDALDAEVKAHEDIFALETEIATARSEAVAKESALAKEAADKISDLETEAGEKRAEVVADGLNDIYKIERDFNRSRTDSVRERDVGALIKAREHAADQLEDQQKAESKQLKSVETALGKQEKAVKSSLDKQVATTEVALGKEVATKQRALQQAQVDLQNATFAAQAIALSGAGTQRVIHTQLWQDVNNIAVTWASNTLNTLRTIFGIGGARSPYFSGTLPPVTGTAAFNRAVDTRIGNALIDIMAGPH
jgi:hypothetical protein